MNIYLSHIDQVGGGSSHKSQYTRPCLSNVEYIQNVEYTEYTECRIYTEREKQSDEKES